MKEIKLLRSFVLHSKDTSKVCKVVLSENFVEDVEICMDMLKYFGNLSFLVPSHLSVYFPIGPMDPSTPENLLV
jgi:hypothetical protein